jgi:DNA invertase Pin-like site-specific DNA recombinase
LKSIRLILSLSLKDLILLLQQEDYVMFTFAQFERELASERTKDKMLERAKKGMWNGGIVPYGYKKENKKLVINPKEAEIVKLIYEIYTSTGFFISGL